jgi:hypothetical protein
VSNAGERLKATQFLNVRFASESDQMVRCREMTRCARRRHSPFGRLDGTVLMLLEASGLLALRNNFGSAYFTGDNRSPACETHVTFEDAEFTPRRCIVITGYSVTVLLDHRAAPRNPFAIALRNF